MGTEALTDRLNQLNQAIDNATQSIFILRGHKAEVEFQLKLALEEAEALATQVENPVV